MRLRRLTTLTAELTEGQDFGNSGERGISDGTDDRISRRRDRRWGGTDLYFRDKAVSLRISGGAE